jgi:hypothetical protein
LGEPLSLKAKAELVNGAQVDVTSMISAQTLNGHDPSKTGTQQIRLTLAGIASAPLAIEVKTLTGRIAAGNGLILLYADETWPAVTTGANLGNNKDIILRAAANSPQSTGCKITLTGTGKMFILEDDAKLTLDSGVTLEGNSGNNTCLLAVTRGGITMKPGAQIIGNKGGGINITMGSFTMEGGRISGNTGAASGGAISSSYGVIIIKDGEISKNSASSGGAIYISGGNFVMKGGTISGNDAQSQNATGGGICLLSGSFAMEGGEVSGNTAAGPGGGVYISSNCFFTMKDGKVTGNRSNETGDAGGGIFIGSNSTFNFENGEIGGNSAAGKGGGVFFAFSATFNKSSGGGIIHGSASGAQSNKASMGHALYLSQGGSAKYRDTTVTRQQKLLASGGIFTLGDWRD